MNKGNIALNFLSGIRCLIHGFHSSMFIFGIFFFQNERPNWVVSIFMFTYRFLFLYLPFPVLLFCFRFCWYLFLSFFVFLFRFCLLCFCLCSCLLCLIYNLRLSVFVSVFVERIDRKLASTRSPLYSIDFQHKKNKQQFQDKLP